MAQFCVQLMPASCCPRPRKHQRRKHHLQRNHNVAVRAAGSPAPLESALENIGQLLERSVKDSNLEFEDEAVSQARAAATAGVLCGFGSGPAVPKRDYSLAELRLNKIEPTALLSPRDKTLEGVRSGAAAALAVGVAAVGTALHAPISAYVQGGLALAFLVTLDEVGNQGAAQALAVDSLGRLVSSTYAERVAAHEAAHFVVAYLLGVLPKAYTLSSWDALNRNGSLNVQAGTVFCDGAFQREVAGGTISSGSVGTFTCIALAGVAQEYLSYGQSEGGLSDVLQLDALLRGLGFTQKRADSEVRWAVLNTVYLLRQQASAHAAVAAAMQSGAPVAEVIAAAERALNREALRGAGKKGGAGEDGSGGTAIQVPSLES